MMVGPTPIWRECKLGKGTVVDGSRGCVIDINEWMEGEDPLGCGKKYCTCEPGRCKTDEQTHDIW